MVPKLMIATVGVLGCASTLYIQNRSVLSKLQEKAFDKVVKIL